MAHLCSSLGSHIDEVEALLEVMLHVRRRTDLPDCLLTPSEYSFNFDVEKTMNALLQPPSSKNRRRRAVLGNRGEENRRRRGTRMQCSKQAE